MLRRFFALESASGFVLFGAALLAVAISNSALGPAFLQALHQPYEAALGALAIHSSIELAVNDGLMVLFFLLVSLEIKREILVGELSERAKIALPAVAALGGMAMPALIYVACNRGHADALRGWAIPSATDIAFSLGVLTLLGRRVPVSLKVFLTALAIIDDLGAIIVIALFYTDHLSLPMLGGAVLAGAALYLLNRRGVLAPAPYLLIGALLWFFVLESGVHATLAGVALAFAIPLRIAAPQGHAPLMRLEQALHPWVAFGVLPVFALVNAGVSFAGMHLSTLLLPVPLGIAAGLLLGKAAGIFGSCALMLKLMRAPLPAGATWVTLFGMALLGGIGFTMSLFIGNLAFAGSAEFAAQLRLGVIAGSLLSAVCGYLVLRAAPAARS